MCTSVCTYIIYYIYLSQIYNQVSHYMCLHEYPLFYFLLYNCFTRLCSLLLYKVNQLFVHIHRPPSLASLPLVSHPSRSTQHRVELPVLYSSLVKYLVPLGPYFMHGGVYTSIQISQFFPPSPSPSFHMSILYVCISISALKKGLIVRKINKYMCINKYPLDRADTPKAMGLSFSLRLNVGNLAHFA